MQAEQIHVLFVSHQSDLWGSERSLLSIVDSLSADTRFRIRVVLPCDGPFKDKLRERGVGVWQCRYRYWFAGRRRLVAVLGRLLTNMLACFRLWRMARQERPDVVYSNTIATPVGMMLAAVLRVPHVLHVREFVQEDLDCYYDWGRRPAMAFADRFGGRIICNSEAVRRKYAAFLKKAPMEVIYNGFDFDRITTPSPEEKFERCVRQADPFITLAIVGALAERKGQHEAIRCTGELVDRGYHVQLLIAGEGDAHYRLRLERSVSDRGLEGRVLFTGFARNCDPIFDRAAVCLVCSRAEAFGRVAVEAMARGTPVVARRRGGLPEIVEDNRTGLLYDRNESGEIEDKVERLLADKETFMRLSAAGAAHVRNQFNVEAMCEKIKTAIVTIAGTSGSGSEG